MTNHHDPCRHLRYRMTCAEFDELYERADGRCEVCGVKERYTSPPRLVIDHDGPVGMHGVRGLLCNRCNSCLDEVSMDGPERDAYLACPWHLTSPLRAAAGIVAEDTARKTAEAVARLEGAVTTYAVGDSTIGILEAALDALRAGVRPGTVYAAVPFSGNWVRYHARRAGIPAGRSGKPPRELPSLRVNA